LGYMTFHYDYPPMCADITRYRFQSQASGAVRSA